VPCPPACAHPNIGPMSTNYLLSLAGWYFLPNLATGWLQSFYYRVSLRAGEPAPQPGSPQFMKHRRNIYFIVIVAYLLYSIYEADWQLQRESDFYRDLAVPIDVDERTLKSQLRRLLAQTHPDKYAPEYRPAAEQAFIRIRKAHDTLADPVKRFAYDRFGPDTLQWQNCKTIQDYVLHGVQNSAVLYLGMLIMMVMTQVLGMMPHGRYWRFLTIASLLVFEANTITRPHFPLVISNVLNPLFTTFRIHPPFLPFQIIKVARQTAFSVFIAVNQLAPIWKSSPGAQTDSEEAQRQYMSQLRGIAGIANQDAQRLLGLEMAPFAQDPPAEGRLKQQLKAWLLQNEVRNDPGVTAAIQNAVERRNDELQSQSSQHE